MYERSQHNEHSLSCVHDIPSDELKQLCEGGCSVSDIEDKRRDFTQELAEMRTTTEVIPLPLQPSFLPSNSLSPFLSLCFLICSLSRMLVAWHSETHTSEKIAMVEPSGTCRYKHVPLIKGCHYDRPMGHV